MPTKKRDRLGIPAGYHSSKVDVDKIRHDIQTRFPRLWEMLGLHPVSQLKVITDSQMAKELGHSGSSDSGTSAMYNHQTKTIWLNGDAFAELEAEGLRGFNKWTVDPTVGVPTLSQVSKEDFFTILALHEVGHHFQDFVIHDDGLRTITEKSFLLHKSVWTTIQLIGAPPSSGIGDRLAAEFGIAPPDRVRPVVSIYAAGDISEYFAEDFALYWYIPADLKLIDSVAYDAVDQVVSKVLNQKEKQAA
jgi:hypothetical protein